MRPQTTKTSRHKHKRIKDYNITYAVKYKIITEHITF